MTPSKKDTNSLNSIYNPITGMYENATGKFWTYAEARQNKWKCTKCAVMFSSYRLLRDHMKDFHSYQHGELTLNKITALDWTDTNRISRYEWASTNEIWFLDLDLNYNFS